MLHDESKLTKIFNNTTRVIGKEILQNYGFTIFEKFEDDLLYAQIALLNPEKSDYENAIKSFHIAQNLRCGLMN